MNDIHKSFMSYIQSDKFVRTCIFVHPEALAIKLEKALHIKTQFLSKDFTGRSS